MAVGTSVFSATNPASVDSAATIPTAVNNVVALLDGALSADNYGNGGANQSLSLVSASSLPNVGWISIGPEIISYTGKSTNTLTGITRGAQSTQIRAHVNRAPVFYNLTAAHLNVLTACIIALETMFVNQTFDQGSTSGGNTITLTGTPITGKKVLLWVNGTMLYDTTDFTVSGTVLTYTGSSYPPAGVPYLALYVKQ